jgi:hypothetical protein
MSLTAAPSPLDFGTVTVGASATLTTTLSNVSSTDLQVDLFISGSTDFALNPAAPAPVFVIPPGSTIGVPVDYTPSASSGSVSGVLWVFFCAVGQCQWNTLPVSLSGVGLGVPGIAVSPLALDFGVTSIGRTATLSATINNPSSGTLTVTGLTTTGGPEFALNVAAPLPPFAIAPGASVDVPVDYTPVDQAADSGTLEIASNDADDPVVSVTLVGVGIVVCDIAVAAQLDFGQVLVGTSRTLAVTISNVGSATCTVTALSVTGSAEFALNAAAPVLPFAVAPGASVDVLVDYTPVSVGVDSGTLHVASDASDSPATVALSGTGKAEPDIAISPTGLTYGTITVGSTTTLATTISNLGDADLTVSELTFTGSADFALNTVAPTPPFVVAAGTSIAVPVDYTPSVPKAVNAVLWVVSTDPDEGVVPVQLSGTGIVCDLSVNPLALDFGVVEVGLTQTLHATISNLGNAVCTVTAITLSGSADFALNAAAPAPPFTVTPGASVQVSVDYAPADFVNDVGTLTIASDDPDEGVVSVALSGEPPASACVLDVSPLALDFGTVGRGATQALTATLRNLGAADCTVDFAVTGSADFALNPAAPTPPITLAFGAAVDVSVDYTPSDVGADGGTLDINSNDPTTPLIAVTLAGAGAGIPDIAVGPTTLAFGTVTTGSTMTRTATISNVGDAALVVTELAFSGSSDFALNTAAPVPPFTVAPGATIDVLVDYTPSVERAVKAVLWVVSDDPDEGVLPVSLAGTGVGTPDIAVGPTTLAFGTVTTGSTTTRTATISNTGKGNLTVTELTLAGGGEFTLNAAAPPLPFTVAPSATVDVPVDYTPADTGADGGTLDITSDDPDEGVVTVVLAGTGVSPDPGCDITVTPLVLGFDLVDVGTTQTLAVTIGDTGLGDCTVSGLTLSGPGFALNAAAPALPFTVASGTVVDVPVDFTSSAIGPASGTLDIASDDPDEEVVTVALAGTGKSGSAFVDPPHSDLPLVAGEDVCYSCHVTRRGSGPAGIVLQRQFSTDICLQCHGENPPPNTDGAAPLVPLPVAAPQVNLHASTVTGSTRFQYEVKCTDCHNPHKHSAAKGWQQIRYIKDLLNIPGLMVTDLTRTPPLTLSKDIASYIRFTNRAEFDYVGPDPFIRGICNTCHTQTDHHCNETLVPTGLCDSTHNIGTPCTGCHTHTTGFFPACGSCHDLPPATGSHLKHFQGDASLAEYGNTNSSQDYASEMPIYLFNCGNCHPLDPSRHLNHVDNAGGGSAEVELYNPAAPTGSLKALNPPTATYNPGSTVLTDAYGLRYTEGTCSDVYCHSYKQVTTTGVIPEPSVPPDTPPLVYDPPWQDLVVEQRLYQSPKWGDPSAGCGGCHQYPIVTSEPDVSAGAGDSHGWVDDMGYTNLHLWNMSFGPLQCNICHHNTVRAEAGWQQTPDGATTFEDIPIYNASRHVNGRPDIAFTPVPVLYETFDGQVSYDLSTAIWDEASKSCMNVGCHLNQTTVTWGSPYRWWLSVECNVCHQR